MGYRPFQTHTNVHEMFALGQSLQKGNAMRRTIEHPICDLDDAARAFEVVEKTAFKRRCIGYVGPQATRQLRS